MKERPTDYQATWRFTLRDPNEYFVVDEILRAAIREIEQKTTIQAEGVLFERVPRG